MTVRSVESGEEEAGEGHASEKERRWLRTIDDRLASGANLDIFKSGKSIKMYGLRERERDEQRRQTTDDSPQRGG